MTLWPLRQSLNNRRDVQDPEVDTQKMTNAPFPAMHPFERTHPKRIETRQSVGGQTEQNMDNLIPRP